MPRPWVPTGHQQGASLKAIRSHWGSVRGWRPQPGGVWVGGLGPSARPVPGGFILASSRPARLPGAPCPAPLTSGSALDRVNPPGNLTASVQGHQLAVGWQKPLSAFRSHCFLYEVRVHNPRTGLLQVTGRAVGPGPHSHVLLAPNPTAPPSGCTQWLWSAAVCPDPRPSPGPLRVTLSPITRAPAPGR